MESIIVKHDGCSHSGILIDNTFILITAHCFLTPISCHNYNCLKTTKFSIIQNENNDYLVKDAFVIGCFDNDEIVKTVHICFGEIIDCNNDNQYSMKNLFKLLILTLYKGKHIDNFVTHLNKHHNIYAQHIQVGEQIILQSAPFGARLLLPSYAEGIVCNHLDGLMLTDFPAAPGCEGGLIIAKQSGLPLGILVCISTSWQGECTGLSLALTFAGIFHKLLATFKISKHEIKVLNQLNDCLLYVISGTHWGTGICIDKRKGLILTNAHVIENSDKVCLIFQGAKRVATVVYKVPHMNHFDLALLQSNSDLPEQLHSVRLSKDELNIGDKIYACGYPLFPHHKGVPATITQGHVSHKKRNLIMSTCTVLPGASGGGVFNIKGELAGIITCNLKDDATNITYPRINFIIPLTRIKDGLFKYIQSNDIQALDLWKLNEDATRDWVVSKL